MPERRLCFMSRALPFHSLESQGAAVLGSVDHHTHLPAVADFAADDRTGETGFQIMLTPALERTRAVGGVVRGFGDELEGVVGKFQSNHELVESLLEAH